jgi:hypothetical protein
MSILKTKTKLSDEQEYQLLDYVIYGVDTLIKLLNTATRDVSNDIKRCDTAKDSLGTALRFASEHDVCKDCKDVHSSLIRDAEESHSELDFNFDAITNAYSELQEENSELRNIIQDLIQYAVSGVPCDDRAEFEEHLILKTLSSNP